MHLRERGVGINELLLNEARLSRRCEIGALAYVLPQNYSSVSYWRGCIEAPQDVYRSSLTSERRDRMERDDTLRDRRAMAKCLWSGGSLMDGKMTSLEDKCASKVTKLVAVNPLSNLTHY